MSKDDDKQPLMFIQDLSRTSLLQYEKTENFWKWIDTYIYRIPDATMLNQTANTENIHYQVYVDGTTNMTTSNLVNSFVSKGHFYQISPVVASSVPVITD
jgi:hypothetical protein